MVWDIWVRLGHWLVVGLIAFQFYSGEQLDLRDIHAWVGIALLSWIGFRLLWGFVGPTHARFSDFVKSPKRVWGSFVQLFRREHESAVGHTAAGGIGVIVLMALITTLAITGLLSTDDVFYDGPLNHWVSYEVAVLATRIHHLAGNLLILTIAGHVCAIAWHQFAMRQPLIQGMLHGKKPGVTGSIASSVTIRGALVLLASAIVIAGSIGLWGRF